MDSCTSSRDIRFLLYSLTIMNFFKSLINCSKQVKHQRLFFQRFKNLSISAQVQEKIRVTKFSQI